MIYVKSVFIFFWLMFTCAAGLVASMVRWGDLNLNHDFARLFAWGAMRVSGIRVNVEGREHLEAHQPCIYVGNHQSGLDMATFGSIYPHKTVVVGKKELLWIPFFGLYFKAAGNILLNREKRVTAIASLARVVKAVQEEKISVWIFPEGTRNTTSEPMLPFKKGAFYLALQAKVPIVALVSSPLSKVLSWEERRMTPGCVTVRVLPPIDTSGYGENDVNRLASDVRAVMLEALRSLS